MKFESFFPVLRRAQSRGYVKDYEAEYVVNGLMNGFTSGLDVAAMKRMGKRAFRNYPTAYAAHASVTAAVTRRVHRHKTVNTPNQQLEMDLWSARLNGATAKTLRHLHSITDGTPAILRKASLHNSLSDSRILADGRRMPAPELQQPIDCIPKS